MTKTAIENSPLSGGRKHMLRFIKGESITRSQAMKAKCFECCNGFIDGRVDCGIRDCPIYPWMPYRTEKGGSNPDA